MPLQRCLSSDSMTSMVYSTRAVKIPAASGGALEGRSLSCWGNLSPKPPNKDAIPPHRKQWGILASFRGLEAGVIARPAAQAGPAECPSVAGAGVTGAASRATRHAECLLRVYDRTRQSHAECGIPQTARA